MKIIIGLLVLSSFSAFAGPKEDFVNAVVKQCKKSAGDAEALATPGRTGTVMGFNTCTSATFEVSGDCKLSCADKSSSIGG